MTRATLIKRIGLAICLSVGLGLGALIVLGPEIEVSMSEAEIREKVAAEIPKTVSHPAGTAEITALDLDLLETDQVAVDLAMTVTAFGMTADVAGKSKTGLRYEGGNFYLADLVLDDLEITPDEEATGLIGDVGKAASSAFRNMFSNDDVAGSDGAAARLEERLRAKIGPVARSLSFSIRPEHAICPSSSHWARSPAQWNSGFS